VRWRLPLVIGVVVIGALVWLWRSALDPVVESARPAERAPEPRVATRAPVPSAPEQRRTRAYSAPRVSSFDATSYHTADPCTALSDPIVPPGYEQITEHNITVAWDPGEATGPYDAPLRPIALAHTTAGLLEEAAQLTGTNRRESLTVIVDASSESMQSRTKVPAWVGGLYDGGAIHLYAKPTADLGVVITTLRHEIMHAQMHAAIGCTPFWFNEGLANYFAQYVPTREWFAMLRTGDPFDLAVANAPVVLDLRMENAQRLYAVALAMVVYIVHHGGEQNLRRAVQLAMNADSDRDALDLWNQIHPNTDYRAVIESLAQRIFRTPLGPELELVMRGSVCCRDLRSPSALACRAGTPGELGVSKGDYCRTRW
jgi:hypothetical protein